jgi:hypothetical protein
MRLPVAALYTFGLLATAAIAFWMGDSRRSEPGAGSDRIAAPDGESGIESEAVPAIGDAADVIDGLLGHPSEFAFTRATLALAASSSPAELETYILAASGAADPRRGLAIAHIMLSAYVDLDPVAAFDFARLLPANMRVNALFRVFADWSATDPDAAIAAVDRLRDPRERRAAEDGILQTASIDGPQSVSAMADRLGRNDASRAALQQQTQSDPRTAIEDARRLPQSERIAAVSNIGGRWAAQDPEAAYAYANALPNDSIRDFMMRAVVATWSRSQPERVVGILDAGVAANDVHTFIHYGIAEMARIDAARAFALVTDMRNAPMRAAAMHPLMQVWADDDPYEAVAALDTLTTPDVRELAILVGPLFARVAPQRALDWAIEFDQGRGVTWRAALAEVARQDISFALNLARQTPQIQLNEALILVVGASAQRNPDAAARALSELPPEARGTGTQHVVTEWIKRDATAAQRWVLSQPWGPDRDRGLEVLTGDPNTPGDQLALLVNAIDAENRRVSTATSLIEQRFRGDITAARTFLSQLDLPREAHEQIERRLNGEDRVFR